MCKIPHFLKEHLLLATSPKSKSSRSYNYNSISFFYHIITSIQEKPDDIKFQKKCNLKRHPKCKKLAFGIGFTPHHQPTCRYQ